MSKTVTFTDDVFPYCVGDVMVLNDDELKAVDAIAKARKHKVYETGAKQEVDSSDEADRQEADRKAAEAKVAEEAKAEQKLRDVAAKKAAAAAQTSPSGTEAPGTTGGDSVKTAAASGKDGKSSNS